MLGTPPMSAEGEGPKYEPLSFISAFTSMSQVCHRWKKMVRSSDGVWRSICEWRWPWLGAEQEEGMIDKVVAMDDPRYLCVKGEEKESISLHFNLCSSMGRCRWEGGGKKQRPYFDTEDRYLMVVEMHEEL